MANPCKVMLPVALLILAATQGYCSQPDQARAALVDSMRGIGQALQCISDSTQDGMRLQRESTDSLRDVVIKLTQEIQVLQRKMESNNEMIQEMNKKFMESQQRVELLEETVRQLNDTMKNQSEEECEITVYRQHKQEIDELVGEFIRTSSWISLMNGFGLVLDHNDELYHILQNMGGVILPMWHIGSEGYTQLALLLLCAGLPVNFTDTDGDSMLHGAAEGGQLELVKLLVHHGADVNMTGFVLTPLQRARNNGRSDVVAYLEQLSH